jgi:hypothetical protein
MLSHPVQLSLIAAVIGGGKKINNMITYITVRGEDRGDRKAEDVGGG